MTTDAIFTLFAFTLTKQINDSQVQMSIFSVSRESGK